MSATKRERKVASPNEKKLGTEEARTAAQGYFSEVINDECKQIKDVKIVGIKQIKESNVTILTFPYKDIGSVLKCSQHFVPGLEKKFGGHVFVVGQRRAFPVEPEHGRRHRRFRPAKRMLRLVNEAYLQDLVHGHPIASKMTHYDHDGKQKTTVVLASRSKDLDENRLRALGSAYERLTGMRTEFVKQAQQ